MIQTNTATKSKLQLMLHKIRLEREAESGSTSAMDELKLIDPQNPICKSPEWKELYTSTPKTDFSIQSINEPVQADSNVILDKYGKPITLNSNQMRFVETAGTKGQSAVLIGAAGTGKTTTQKAVCQALIQSGRAGILDSGGHKHLPATGVPGIVICAYTRRAVANIRRNLPTDLQANAITIHKLLEYSPVYYTVMDDNTGEEKTKMVFEATRNASNPLPRSIKCIIFEEASMLGTDLYKEVRNACPHAPQEIFLGDIQQLPPVFGPAILGFKLLELPTIELTEVYRQALESPIISLAHRILSGTAMESKEFPDWKKPGLTLHPWKKKINPDDALNTAAMFLTQAIDAGAYDPNEDAILIPYNKSFGTDELNKKIANHLARKSNLDTYQIIAGFNKYYLTVGDKVLYDKEDATVIRIEPNPTYSGIKPIPHSKSLDYWGTDLIAQESHQEQLDDNQVDFLLSQSASKDSDERVRQASHIITLQMNDSELEIKLDKASELNGLLLGYCLTVHKSQGSEWRKVFVFFHQSHATLIQRELLYTAVTRAREELYIICEPETFIKGITSQRVKGNTLEEKAEFFKGKIDSGFSLE